METFRFEGCAGFERSECALSKATGKTLRKGVLYIWREKCSDSLQIFFREQNITRFDDLTVDSLMI
jgi:hypothetical protein